VARLLDLNAERLMVEEDDSGIFTKLVDIFGNVRMKFYKTPVLYYSHAIPSGIACNGNVGTNGALTLGAFPAGSLSFSATSGVGVTVTGTGTTFAAADVGRAIIVDGGKICTITAQATPNCTVTITGTLSTTSFANNAWQLTSLMPFTYGPGGASAGIWLYLPAGAAYAGSVAGSYWTVMSSGAVGTIYNNILSLPGPLTPPTTPTAISAAGPGAFTGAGATLRSVAGVTIPAGMMGLNGAVRVTAGLTVSNPVTAGTKNYQVTHGGAVTNTLSMTANTTAQEQTYTQNRGSATTQYSQRGNTAGFGASASSFGTVTSIDTSQDQPLLLQLQGAAADYCVLEAVTVEVLTN
jgi:hypothetical protein